MVKKSTIVFNALLLLLITATIPYFAYGVTAIRTGYEVVGGLNTSGAVSGGIIGTRFSHFKDVIATVLFLYLFIINKKKKYLGSILGVFLYGLIALVISGRIQMGFLIAGFRTFLFFLTMLLFFESYGYLFHDRKKLRAVYYITQIVIILQTVIVAFQISMSNSWFRFGSGAYRYSGLFPGSGNLGCYAIAALLTLMIMSQKYKVFSDKVFIIDGIFCCFLSVASGTRTCIILSVICFVYSLFINYGDALHFNKSVIIFLLLFFAIFIGYGLINSIISRIGRGDLMASGEGRIRLFLDMFNSSSGFELLFGRGLGVGTNASISMGLSGTQVSDSTINLLFTQFGMVGLLIFVGALVHFTLKIYCCSKQYRYLGICMIGTIWVMFLVGNLFEHIGMSIYFSIGYFLLLEKFEITPKVI